MLAQVLPPFVFSCDFTHQLGREGPRKPLQPAWEGEIRGPSGAKARERKERKGF